MRSKNNSPSTFIERLVNAKAKTVFTSYHFYLIIALMAVLGYVYYMVLTNFHDIYLILFFYPLLYASIVYRLRGVIGCGLLFLCIVLPYTFILSVDQYSVIRALLFAAFALIVSGLVASELNYSEMQLKTFGRLRQLMDEVGKLEGERELFLRFLGTAAHDMKAPLAAIQGDLWIMLSGFTGKLVEKQQSIVERSSARIEELRTLIDDLLDIPRIESGHVAHEMAYFSLRNEIEQCVKNLNSLIIHKNVELTVNIPEDIPDIYGSSSRIRQVLQNLINNAISYTNEGVVTVGVTRKDGEIQVDVVDTGIGIPTDELPKIFEDFFRASNVEIKGTGLGLSIAKRIVEAHGGKIWVETSSSGSKFSFTLSIDKKEAQA